MIQYDVIIPVAAKDISVVLKTIPEIFTRVTTKQVIIISSTDVQELIENSYGDRVTFLNEDDIVDGLTFQGLYDRLKKKNAEKRTGWYYQQFIKYAYASISSDEFYLCWDADTVPLKEISMFRNNHPIFVVKKEYHRPYFSTIESVLGIKKQIKSSFIAEHMLFSRDFVKEVILKIEEPGDGLPWYDVILEHILDSDISGSGYSEFETYGTYMLAEHPEVYGVKKISAIRQGTMIFGECPDEKIMSWLGKKYSTISFEKSQTKKISTDIYKRDIFRKLVCPSIFVLCCKIWLKIRGT